MGKIKKKSKSRSQVKMNRNSKIQGKIQGKIILKKGKGNQQQKNFKQGRLQHQYQSLYSTIMKAVDFSRNCIPHACLPV